MTPRDIQRKLMFSEYTCHEFPHVVLKFIPGGLLQVFGEKTPPIQHRYTITHKDDKYYMRVSPAIMSKNTDMAMVMNKNHVTLSIDDGKGRQELLHLSKILLKPFESDKEY